MSRVNVKASQRFNVDPKRVFDSFFDPEKAKRFMFATLTGKMVKAEVDGRVGGNFLFIDRRPDGDASHYGTFTKIESPNLIVFEFAVAKNAEKDPVIVEIHPLKQGCEVTVTHQIKKEYAHLEESVALGWENILDNLGSTLRRR